MRSKGTLLLSAALIVAIVGIVGTQQAHAQQVALAPAAQDDVAWEERREPYNGQPLRPGAELDASLSPLIWPGVGGFVAGYAFGAIYGGLNAFPEAAIPLAGPWVVVANPDPLAQALLPWMIISGIAQPAGLVVMIIGLATPSYAVVYSAPVGSPSPFQPAQVRVLPGAVGADLGVSLSVETF